MERQIQTYGKTNAQKLREFKGVRTIVQLKKLYPQAKTNEDAYILASREYNYNLIRQQQERTQQIANSKRNMSLQLAKLAKNQNEKIEIDISKLHLIILLAIIIWFLSNLRFEFDLNF